MSPTEFPRSADAGADRLYVFAALWAVASLFHVLGPSGRAFGVLADRTGVGVAQAAVAIVALVVLVAPRAVLPLAVLAVLGVVTAWQEAPVLGNHWLLAAFADVVLLAALVVGRGRPVRTAGLALGPLRALLVVFYSFAAFAKLNSAFFDTTVSCASVFADEMRRTLHLGGQVLVAGGGAAALVPVISALTEASVPVLLCWRRSRIVGVLLGLAFHGVIALDREHLFSDFSSVLAAFFVLFLPARFATTAAGWWQGMRPVRWGVTAGLAALVALECWGPVGGTRRLFDDGTMWAWWIAGFGVVAGVAVWTYRERRDGRGPTSEAVELLPDVPARWLLVVPVLAGLNGLGPYVEMKTAFSYSMYSNLAVLDGSSNHFLVRATLPLGHRQAGLVRLLSTDDPNLQGYINEGYDLPYDSFRAYVSEHPDIAVRFERDGVLHDVARVADDPALRRAPPEWVTKFLPLRAVDRQDPPRCQETFLPAS